ncbi:MAG TPA: hypothetical protein PKN33_05055 [Phycisphaerae bacterium]|nr:hypothetical protein [Phycisphaerae bacterium]
MICKVLPVQYVPSVGQRRGKAEMTAQLRTQFKSLDKSANRQIVRAEVAKLGQRFGLVQRKLELQTDDTVIDWIVQKSFDPEQGARAVRRAVERWLTTELARVMVQEFPPADSCIRLTLKDGKPFAIVVPSDTEGAAMKFTPATVATHTNHRNPAERTHSRSVASRL